MRVDINEREKGNHYFRSVWFKKEKEDIQIDFDSNKKTPRKKTRSDLLEEIDWCDNGVGRVLLEGYECGVVGVNADELHKDNWFPFVDGRER